MPVARHNAFEIDGHIWETPVVPVCGVMPVSAIVRIFLSIVHIAGTIEGPLLK